jgi:hypothetical protein
MDCTRCAIQRVVLYLIFIHGSPARQRDGQLSGQNRLLATGANAIGILLEDHFDLRAFIILG